MKGHRSADLVTTQESWTHVSLQNQHPSFFASQDVLSAATCLTTVRIDSKHGMEQMIQRLLRGVDRSAAPVSVSNCDRDVTPPLLQQPCPIRCVHYQTACISAPENDQSLYFAFTRSLYTVSIGRPRSIHVFPSSFVLHVSAAYASLLDPAATAARPRPPE